ncbi:LytR C-terminal domain-containing protein [Gryllotalpicola ginsengisoli]|uniref:LytR C-terminal domain-containing protein n=1 Tax=Gryllotalpicola ginsengisoli TaxID=444608 RepID=UPI0003B71085|nr:LytR C-terminal domain-containing protein [Gryllotalpicola ginsengisoli]
MAQNFPKDRFDVVPPDLERVGAHRAPRRPATGLMWLLWCAVAIVVIVGAGWMYLRVLDGSLPGASSASTSTPTASSTQRPTATKSPTPAASPTPTATRVASAPVSVLNGAGITGLAAQGAAKLTAAGWTAVTTGNAPQTGQAATTIYYSDASARGIALGVAQDLGIGSVQQSDEFAAQGAQVVVVLGSDFQP